MQSFMAIEHTIFSGAACVFSLPMNLPLQMDWQRFSLSPSQGERAGVRGLFLWDVQGFNVRIFRGIILSLRERPGVQGKCASDRSRCSEIEMYTRRSEFEAIGNRVYLPAVKKFKTSVKENSTTPEQVSAAP